MDPVVSVIIPHFNRAERLAQTAATVLAQSFQQWELIIVDDNSPQDPVPPLQAILSDERVRLIRQPQNRGPSAARNVGVSVARGRFVAFLDSDDAWDANKLQSQVDLVLSSGDPDGVICTTRTRKVSPHGESVAPDRGVVEGEDFSDYLIINGGVAQTSSILVSRSAAEKITFAEDMRQFEDYLFFIKAGGIGLKHILAPDPLVIWYNDERPDRLSKGSDRSWGNAVLFLQRADGLISKNSEICFLTKHIAPIYLKEKGLMSLPTFVKSLRRGFIKWHAFVWLLIKSWIPGAYDLWSNIRSAKSRRLLLKKSSA